MNTPEPHARPANSPIFTPAPPQTRYLARPEGRIGYDVRRRSLMVAHEPLLLGLGLAWLAHIGGTGSWVSA